MTRARQRAARPLGVARRASTSRADHARREAARRTPGCSRARRSSSPATSTAPRCGPRSTTSGSPPRAAASWPGGRRVSAGRRLPPPAGDARRDRRRFATVPAGVVLDATLGGGGHSRGAPRQPRRPAPCSASTATRRARRRRPPGWPASATASRRRRTRRFDDLADVAAIDRRPSIDGGSAARCSTSACRRPSSTAPSAGSRTATTDRSTCAWTRRRPWSAADVVNGYDAERARPRASASYGDERFADRIARAIVAARPIESTTELAADRHRGHPGCRPPHAAGTPPSARSRRSGSRSTASSTCCPTAIDEAIDATAPGGRIAVLSYHSGEDRIVKERFRRGDRRLRVPARPAVRVRRGADRAPRPRHPADRPTAEQAANRRAASARLRVAEQVGRRRTEARHDGTARRCTCADAARRRHRRRAAARPRPRRAARDRSHADRRRRRPRRARSCASSPPAVRRQRRARARRVVVV